MENQQRHARCSKRNHPAAMSIGSVTGTLPNKTVTSRRRKKHGPGGEGEEEDKVIYGNVARVSFFSIRSIDHKVVFEKAIRQSAATAVEIIGDGQRSTYLDRWLCVCSTELFCLQGIL